MRICQQLCVWSLTVGLLCLFCGGMSIKRDPDGTWFQVGPVQFLGLAALLCGTIFAALALFLSRPASVPPELTKTPEPGA